MLNIDESLSLFSRGEIIIVFDDENRENEADLIVAIDKLTPEKVNFLITHAKGLLCAVLSEEIVTRIGLPLMPNSNTDPHSTAFTLSVDSRNVKTGISAKERCITAKELIDSTKTAADFVTPGHLFPLVAKTGGLLQRRGHTEAAACLCSWNNLPVGALICEMVHDDGDMYSIEQAKQFAEEHNIPFCTVEELVRYQYAIESSIEKINTTKLKNSYGEFDVSIYNDKYDSGKEYVFLSMGDFRSGIFGIHSECFMGDVLSSCACDCQEQLNSSLKHIAAEQKGALLYLRQEGYNVEHCENNPVSSLIKNKDRDTSQVNLTFGHQVDSRQQHNVLWVLRDQGYTNVHLKTNCLYSD